MYTKLKYFAVFLLLAIAAVMIAGMYKFNIAQDDLFIEAPSGEMVLIDEYINESPVADPIPPSAEEQTSETEPEVKIESEHELVGVWLWTETSTNADPEEAVATQPQSDAFTLTFNEDGSMNGTTDCNGFSGSYDLNSDDGFMFGPIMSTLMYCEGSQEGDFHNMLKNISTYFINDDGELVMEMWADGGALVFENI